ncbi:MAG: branched-chain amino acid ABC transporter permease [Thermodesulfobacteriota bacterium]|nr:branched-chain amino acid ABC transporter permease [Thermodesulfobacteriota bacterium]
MLGQVLVNGLLQGGFYACIGVSFSIVFGIMKIINLAQGTQVILGAYITYAASHLLGLDPFFTLPLSIIGLFILGYMIQKYLINLVAKGGLIITSLLTFGLNLILINIALLIWKADFRGTNPWYMGMSFEVAGVTIPYVRLLIFVIAILFTIVLELFFRKTETGNSIRATALNPKAAQLMGIDIGKTYCLTFAISSALGGAMGTLFILAKPISPFTGGDFLIILFSVAILGGLGSIPGALLAGIVLGMVESFSTMFFGIAFQNVVLNLVFILILIFLPTGFMGKRFYG